MKEIILLTDYKERFGSKHFDKPYRSGMDKDLLAKYFEEFDFRVKFVNISQVNFQSDSFEGRNVLYTSSEDDGYYYKNYIEDIVLGLELKGANVIPAYKYLKANNNKVFMEILRVLLPLKKIYNISSCHFGTIEDLALHMEKVQFPCVLKSSAGASGAGVFLVKNKKDLIKKANKISRSKNFFSEIWDWGRSKKHSGYKRESRNRVKFVLQEYVPGLKNDWKIYIFGKKLYIFYRPVLKGRGIKASGGGYDNYFYGLKALAPQGIFDFAQEIFAALNVPHASLDIAYDGDKFYLIEFQTLYFGTAGIPYSDGYFLKQHDNWQFITEKLAIEKVYADSIAEYINQ